MKFFQTSEGRPEIVRQGALLLLRRLRRGMVKVNRLFRIAGLIAALLGTASNVLEYIDGPVRKPLFLTHVIFTAGMWLWWPFLGSRGDKRPTRTLSEIQPLEIIAPILLLLGGCGALYFSLHKG